MLQNTRELYGNRITALDGDVGTAKDFYFDDKHWLVRYLVAETGPWLSGRLILLCPHSLGEVDLHGKMLHVELLRKQIQDSPAIDSQIPISRQYEMEYYRYYGLPVYWTPGAFSDLGGNRLGLPRSRDGIGTGLQRRHRDDKHLQSAKSVNGFNIQALDGMLGRVGGVLVDDRDWSIPALVVEIGHWYSEKEILISSSNVDRVSYEDSMVFVNLTRTEIQQTPETNLAKAVTSENGRNHFHD
jgi:hypothetical protein